MAFIANARKKSFSRSRSKLPTRVFVNGTLYERNGRPEMSTCTEASASSMGT